MKTVRTVAALLACLGMAVPTQACCLFPWFPTYGYGYSAGYAPPVYTAGYYSAGYAPMINSGCCDPCASCCPTSCSSCAGGSCSSCAPTEIRNRAVPDPISNDRREDSGNSDRDRRFNDGGGTYNDDPTNRDGAGQDDFGGQRDWNPSGENDGGTADPFPDTGGRGSRFNDNMGDDIPGLDGFSNRPPMDGLDNGGTDNTNGAGGTDAGTDDSGVESILNRNSNKPPINLPVEDEAGAAGSGSAGGKLGTETDSSEFLGPEDEAESTDGAFRGRLLSRRDSRTSHFGVLQTKRLAASLSEERSSATAVSSSVKKQTPVRWISLPAPVGQVRS